MIGSFALFCSCASAATYWVSTTGNDSNAGTQSAPFRRVSKGAAVARAGDTVMVMDGTYDNEGVAAPNFVVTLYYSGTASSPITFQAQNRGKAILNGGNTSTQTCNGAASYFNLYNASFVVIQGFVIQNACDSGFQSNDSAHDITIKWNEIRNIGNWYITDQIGRDGIYLNSSEYNFTFDGNVWHDIGRVGGNTLHFDHGIYTHAAGVKIINNIFYNMKSGWAIQMADGAKNYLIANNTFAFPNTGNGEAGQIMWWGANTNITVQNNIFYQPTSYAMTQYAATISGCVFDHNVVYPVSGVMSSTAGCTVTSNLTGSNYNPTFLNASSAPYDFTTQSNGAGVNAGLNLSSVAVDHVGVSRPQGSNTDVGAYEYVTAATAPPPVISGVFVTNITTNSLTVNWSTDRASSSYVQYGTGSYTSTTPTDSTMVTSHSVTLTGLNASTLYHFRTGSTDANGQLTLSTDYTATTAAVPTVASTFSLTPSATAASVVQGAAITGNVTATLLTGNPVTVSFTASGLPSGATAAFSPSSCTATCAPTVTVSTATGTPTGAFNLTVTGTGGGYSASTNVSVTVTGTPTGGNSLPDVTTGLAARWKMTEGSGGMAMDSSGNGNHATLYNPTWWVSDLGTTAWFSGTNSYGSVNESASLKAGNQLTVSFWLRASKNSNKDPRVISKNYVWDVKLNGPNRHPQFSAGSQYIELNYTLPALTWHHVVFTFSNGTATGYVDGVAAPVVSNTFNGSSSLAQYAYGLSLATDSGRSNPYIGSLDDVRVYSRALSTADVAALFATKPQ